MVFSFLYFFLRGGKGRIVSHHFLPRICLIKRFTTLTSILQRDYKIGIFREHSMNVLSVSVKEEMA
jgi:hypothetical protein